MAMACYIEGNIESIASECAQRAGRPPSRPGSLGKRAQHRRLGRSLHAIAAAMNERRPRRDPGESASLRSGDSPAGGASNEASLAGAASLRSTAERQAEHFYARGLTLDEMMAEYSALRAIVMRRWIDYAPKLDREAWGELLSFNEAVDESLTAAVLGLQERIDRTRDVFAAVVAHDLRAPLGVVLASAELVLVDGESARHAVAAGRARDAALQMRRIIGDLLDLARVRIGAALVVHRQRMDLGDMCRRVAEAVRSTNPGATVEVHCAGDLTGRWDAGRLEQMLTNIVTNAVLYGRREAPVTVTAKDGGRHVALTVHNAGRPIPSRVRRAMRHPLEMLARGRAPERRQGHGLGLGLFIARSIALAHGGEMEIESEASRGTTVTIRLPRDGVAGAGAARND